MSNGSEHLEILEHRNRTFGATLHQWKYGGGKEFRILSLTEAMPMSVLPKRRSQMNGNLIIGENRTFRGPEDYRAHGVEVIVREDLTCVAMMQRLKDEHQELWNEDRGEQ